MDGGLAETPAWKEQTGRLRLEGDSHQPLKGYNTEIKSGKNSQKPVVLTSGVLLCIFPE
jgi:hypothetical protein